MSLRRSRPLIGLTTYPPNPGDRYELPRPYVDAVRRAGGEPVLVPPGVDDPAGLLDRLDGLLLAGGGDIDPTRYGGSAHETVYSIDPVRDEGELALAHTVLERGVPTLAICRGMQVVNVALGGSLHVHLPEVVDGTVVHRKEPEALRGMPGPTPHEVEVEPASLVAEVMGADRVTPMSWHHQAVHEVGDRLRVVARASDGTVEALEHESHPWLAIVQWHPELTAAGDPTQQRLFDVLVERAAIGS
jgi:putative glutamine amidotransferase